MSIKRFGNRGLLIAGSGTVTSQAALVTLLDITGKGVLHYLKSYTSSASGGMGLRLTIDGVVITYGSVVNSGYGTFLSSAFGETGGNSYAVISRATLSNLISGAPLEIPFNKSLKIEAVAPDPSTLEIYWLYSLLADEDLPKIFGRDILSGSVNLVGAASFPQSLLEVQGCGRLLSVQQKVNVDSGSQGYIRITLDGQVITYGKTYNTYARWATPTMESYINAQKNSINQVCMYPPDYNAGPGSDLGLPFYKSLKIEASNDGASTLSFRWSYGLIRVEEGN